MGDHRAALALHLEFAAEVGQAVVEELDDVEVVEDVERLRQVLADGEDVGRRHVGGDGLDRGVRGFQAFPEGNQGVGAFALADEDHGPANEVEHDGEVAVAVADGDFVDGEALEPLEFGLAEAGFEVAFEEGLDAIPFN